MVEVRISGCLLFRLLDTLEEWVTHVKEFFVPIREHGVTKRMCRELSSYSKKLIWYFITGAYEEVGALVTPMAVSVAVGGQNSNILYMNTPLLLQIIHMAEERTCERDNAGLITIGEKSFKLILCTNMKENGKTKLHEDLARSIADTAWRDMVRWIAREKDIPKSVSQISEYQTLHVSPPDCALRSSVGGCQLMYNQVESLQKRMKSEMAVLRASQRELLRSMHGVEGKVSSVECCGE